MSLRTGSRVSLSPDGARTFEPPFSPDGRFVAFIRAGSRSDDLYVMPLAASFSREPQTDPTEAALLLQPGIVAQPGLGAGRPRDPFLMLVNGSLTSSSCPSPPMGQSMRPPPPRRSRAAAS